MNVISASKIKYANLTFSSQMFFSFTWKTSPNNYLTKMHFNILINFNCLIIYCITSLKMLFPQQQKLEPRPKCNALNYFKSYFQIFCIFSSLLYQPFYLSNSKVYTKHWSFLFIFLRQETHVTRSRYKKCGGRGQNRDKF